MALTDAGKKDGIELWRVEKFALNKIDFEGKLHTGDSYLLLNTNIRGSSWKIHFWLGKETTSDEAGVAAIKAVELDELLGGKAVQYREVEGNESALFLSYFRRFGGIEYLPGGIVSGFHHVTLGEHRNRLLQLHGKHVVRIHEVELSAKSLNKHDVFILDAGLKVFLYNGVHSSLQERAKGIDVSSSIRSSNYQSQGSAVTAQQPEVVLVVEEDPHSTDFWTLLGGEIEVAEGADVPETHSEESRLGSVAKLFSISDVGDGRGDVSDSCSFTAVDLPDGRLHRKMLSSEVVYVLDACEGSEHRLFLWVGAAASSTEKKAAFPLASLYMTQSQLPVHTRVQREAEGIETLDFRSQFYSWTKPASQPPAPPTQAEEEIDVAALLAAPDTDQDDRLGGAATGQLQVWVVEHFDKTPVPEDMHGLFFAGDSYIVQYSFQDKSGKTHTVLYFWLGDESTSDEKGTAAKLVVDMDNALGGAPVQVRVTQGKEPADFRRLFRGRLVVLSGGRGSSFRNTSREADGASLDRTSLFHVKGVGPQDTYSLQVEAKAASLNSRDVFLLVTSATVFVWRGRHSSSLERQLGAHLAGFLNQAYATAGFGDADRPVVTIEEGAEPEDWWAVLGGKTEYAETREGDVEAREPRLFHCIDPAISPSKAVEEIVQFEQEDLSDNDCYVLDCYTEVYLWIGSKVSPAETERVDRVALRFSTDSPDGRGSVPVVRVRAGNEHPSFTSRFPSWDTDYAEKHKFVDIYQARREALEKQQREARLAAETNQKQQQSEREAQRLKAIQDLEVKKPPAPLPAARTPPSAAPPAPPAASPSLASLGSSGTVYSYEELKGGLPADVDPSRKESYLSPEEFERIFKMKPTEFSSLPKWKRDNVKKDVGLF